jgi:hypothetical protein
MDIHVGISSQAFGKNFGSMCPGDNKTRAKGTNTMFVMKETRRS